MTRTSLPTVAPARRRPKNGRDQVLLTDTDAGGNASATVRLECCVDRG